MKLARGLKSFYLFTCISIFVLLIVSCAVGDSNHPGTISDLTIEELTRLLEWTAPGDNGNQGTVTIYFPRYYSDQQIADILGVPNLDNVPFNVIQDTVINNFKDATQVPDFQKPQSAGNTENFLTPRLDITGNTSYFYSIYSNDEAGNSSDPSNVVELTTPLQDVRYVSSAPGSCIGQSVASGNFDGETITQNICIIKTTGGSCNGSGQKTVINDIAIGDPCLGTVYIFYGQNDLTNNGSAVIDVSLADVTIVGNASDGFGASLASTKPLNSSSDTKNLVIGAPDFNNGTGKVYVFFAGKNLPSVVNLVDGSTDHIEVEGENPGDNFGFTVSDGTGVTNGKGVFIVGAPFYSSDTGRAYVFKSGDLDQKNVNQASTSAKAIFTGQQTGGLFGFDIAQLGLIASGGNNEFGVGAPELGKAYVIFGKSDLSSKDLSTDTKDVVILQGSAADGFGTSIAGNGDIDEDGLGTDDVIVGAPSAAGDTGAVFLYSGQNIKDAVNQGTAPPVEAEFTGNNPGDLFGTSVSVFPFLTPGLITKQRNSAIVLQFMKTNADVGVGAPGVPNGAVYIFFGQSDFPSTVPASDADLTVTGQDGDTGFGSVLEELEDVNGDLEDDFGVGGTGFINVYY